MMSRIRKAPAEPQQEQPAEKESIHIVFVATVGVKTGSLHSRNVIGIFDDIVEAKKLERKFNAQQHESEGIISKAFCLRYSMPYVAPAVKELMSD